MSLLKRLVSGGGLIALMAVAGLQPVSGKQPALITSQVNMERISVGSNGIGGGEYAAISSTGRFVAFESTASDLVTGHINDSLDVFMVDRQSHQAARASTRSDGSPVYNPGDYTSPPAISGSGRYVAFSSNSQNLVANDGNGLPDVFVHDFETGQTELISISTAGTSGNDFSSTPAISADGRFVVFQSWADNLTKTDTNQSMDVFIRDRVNQVTEIVSITDSETQGSDSSLYGFPGLSVSDDGRFVSFSYQSLPVVGRPAGAEPGVYLRDRNARTTRFIALGEMPTLSATGRYLAFVTGSPLTTSDKNGSTDVYVFDQTGKTFERISISASGTEVNDHWIFSPPDISADGRYAVYESAAGSIVPGDTNDFADIFLHDLVTHSTTLVSASVSSLPANGESHHPAISDNGTSVAFASNASNLVSGDDNDNFDVFVYDRSALNLQTTLFYLPIISH